MGKLPLDDKGSIFRTGSNAAPGAFPGWSLCAGSADGGTTAI